MYDGGSAGGPASSSTGGGSGEKYEQLAQEIEALDTYWGPTFR